MKPPQIAPHVELQPGAVVKHYELIRKIGAGGMGIVFLARDVRLGRLVAIKFLQKHMGAAAQRFFSEARMTAQCRHENIVIIYDVDELDGRPYMVLEYMKGRNLRDAMNEEHGLSASVAVELVLPVARALACAHEMGIVHRDLKPENILLSDSGQIKVLDFGIAKQISLDLATITAKEAAAADDVELTRNSAIVGTLPYISPEQWGGLPIDGRTDIWSIGVILFELVKGSHPLAPPTLGNLLCVLDLDSPMPSAREALPFTPALADIIDRCLKKRKEERMESAEVLVEALVQLDEREQSSVESKGGESPFAGLSALQESDAARFFGRDDEIAAVVVRLRHEPLVTIAGPSGAGKSSFVRAGVIPALKRAGRHFEAFVVRPGRWPLLSLADVLASLVDGAGGPTDEDPAAIVPILRTQPGYLGAELRARCRKRGAEHRALLFVDQMEELYTQGIDAAERAAFLSCIEGMADDASSPLRVVMTIRADFLDRVSEDRGFSAAMTRGLFFLPPMTSAGLQDALEKPLVALGYRFEDDALCAEMRGALVGTKTPLPALQFTAARLWNARDRERKRLTRAAYRAMGGVAGALSTHADAVLSGLSVPEQRVARAILIRLVTTERTRAVVRLDELFTLSEDGSMVEHVVSLLSDARLVSIEAGGERDGKTVELSHESLIAKWPKLRRWLDETEKDAAFVAELRNAAAQWDKNDRAEGLLWRDQAAIEAGQWLERRKAEQKEGSLGIGKRELSYLGAVVRLSERTKRRRRQWIGGVIAFLGLFAVVVSVLGAQAGAEARRADEKADEAQMSAKEAKKRATEARNATRMASARERISDPTLVLSLIRELEPADSLPPRWSELARWATLQNVARVVMTHAAQVESVGFSPDGKRIVTASWDKTARVWDAEGGSPLVVLAGHRDRVSSAAFSPDGEHIVTASSDMTARVWNADGSGTPLVLAGHEAAVTSAAWSPDGSRIATSSIDKTVRVFRADGRGEPRILAGHRNEVMSVAWSPDGRYIVTASRDGTARIWNADGSGEARILAGHQDFVYFAAFSPDGERIVTASWDKTARVWNADGSGAPRVLEGHQEMVSFAAWSPDGRRIITASADRTARVWNAEGLGKPLVIEGHQEEVRCAAFRPDGERIVTVSYDKTARVWNVDGGAETVTFDGHRDRVWSAAFRPDGKRIVTASGDGTAQVWNADGSGEPVVLKGHRSRVWSALFSPDGKRIVTASADKTVRVWNADGSGEPLVLAGHEESVMGAAFSPDGERIVTASWDKTARVWSADGSGEPIVLAGHEDGLDSASFSPDGRFIVTASEDATARVWNADGRGQPLVLRGHTGGVYSASYSPDGRHIVTGSWDKTARIWNADGSGEPLIFEHPAGVGTGSMGGAGAYSPDGLRIVTISDDKALRVWNADGSGPPAILRIPELYYPTVAAFSPDGTHIVTGSHEKKDPETGKVRYWATVWPAFEPFTGLDDTELWLATRYCPPIELRMELLGVTEKEAEEQFAACRTRVDEAFERARARR